MSRYSAAGRDTADDTAMCALRHGAGCAREAGARPATRPVRPAIRPRGGLQHGAVRAALAQ